MITKPTCLNKSDMPKDQMKGGSMAKGNNSEYKKMIEQQYKDLMKHCQLHMEQIEKDLPEPREDLHEILKDQGFQSKRFH